MDSAYLGMITLWAPNFAPQGWHFCDGTLMPINQYQALYSLLGTQYGGDGINTFGLPDLRSRVPVGAYSSGSNIPLTHYALGQTAGAESTTLNSNQLPPHVHANTVAGAASAVSVNIAIPAVKGVDADTVKPGPTVNLGKEPQSSGQAQPIYSSAATTDTTLEPFAASGTTTPVVTINNAVAGNGAPFDNRQPLLAINFIICVSNGLYPPRN